MSVKGWLVLLLASCGAAAAAMTVAAPTVLVPAPFRKPLNGTSERHTCVLLPRQEGGWCTAGEVKDASERILELFTAYCEIGSTADENSGTLPSSEGQWTMVRRVHDDLRAAGVQQQHLRITSEGYLLAELPGTVGLEAAPKVALFSHVDTARDFLGDGVVPVVYRNYSGEVITFAKGPDGMVLDPARFPVLASKAGRGDTIITASGDTLLGADDKSGVAVMVVLAELLLKRQLPHGPLALAFGPDEEIGHGMKALDLEKLGAAVGYTLDAEVMGDIQIETFSADRAVVEVQGVSIHPCCAKGKLVNALFLVASLVAQLPREGMSPETTEGKQGFIHPYHIEGSSAAARVDLILRDFELEGLSDKRRIVQTACDALKAREPAATVTCTFHEQYRNMRYWLDDNMEPVEVAEAAMLRLGLVPHRSSIRGGTDGSQLTARGLPTPNLFTGWHNAHGPLEWSSLEEMTMTLHVLLGILDITAAHSSEAMQ